MLVVNPCSMIHKFGRMTLTKALVNKHFGHGSFFIPCIPQFFKCLPSFIKCLFPGALVIFSQETFSFHISNVKYHLTRYTTFLVMTFGLTSLFITVLLFLSWIKTCKSLLITFTLAIGGKWYTSTVIVFFFLEEF